jgi:hypothetical protein
MFAEPARRSRHLLRYVGLGGAAPAFAPLGQLRCSGAPATSRAEKGQFERLDMTMDRVVALSQRPCFSGVLSSAAIR